MKAFIIFALMVLGVNVVLFTLATLLAQRIGWLPSSVNMNKARSRQAIQVSHLIKQRRFYSLGEMPAQVYIVRGPDRLVRTFSVTALDQVKVEISQSSGACRFYETPGFSAEVISAGRNSRTESAEATSSNVYECNDYKLAPCA